VDGLRYKPLVIVPILLFELQEFIAREFIVGFPVRKKRVDEDGGEDAQQRPMDEPGVLQGLFHRFLPPSPPSHRSTLRAGELTITATSERQAGISRMSADRPSGTSPGPAER